MSVNPEKPAGYDSDGKPYYKEDNSTEGLAAADSSLPPPPPLPTTPAPPLVPADEPVTDIAPAAEIAPAADIAPAAGSNDINLNISAMIEPNKPAKIGEIKTNDHSLKFSPEIDLVNPTAALDRLSAGIKKIINANAGDPLMLDEAYNPPAQQPTRVQKAKNVAKNAIKGVSRFFTGTKKVAPEPVVIEDSSVRNEMQPSMGGRRMHTKKNRKRRITRSNRKKVRPSRRR